MLTSCLTRKPCELTCAIAGEEPVSRQALPKNNAQRKHVGSSVQGIALDLLGCGASDKPDGADYSIEAQSEIIRKLIDTLGLGKVHVVTHDIGGGIGQILAVKHPEILHTLVLINSVGYNYWPVQPIETMRVPIIRNLAMAVMDLGVLKSVVRRAVYHK